MFGLATSELLIMITITFITIAGMWTTFEKANQSGFASIVPIYNFIVLSIIGKRSPWLILLLIIPFINAIAWGYIMHGVSKSFGKGSGFTAGLIFLPLIFFGILGFGKAEYAPQIVDRRKLNQ